MGFTNPFDRRNRRGDDLPLPEFLNVLWGWRMLVAGAVLVPVVMAAILVYSREPVYTAEATVKIQSREDLATEEDREAFLTEIQGAVDPQGLSEEVMRETGWEGGLAGFRERLDPEVLVTREGDTVLRVRFSDNRPGEAARVANTYADRFVARVDRLNESRLAGGTLAATADVEQRAALPESRTGSRALLYASGAGGIGLLAGATGAFLLESRARRWRDARDAELTLRAPVIGTIPEFPQEQTAGEGRR